MAPSVSEPAATVEEVRAAVHADVARQLVSDVPVGVFLSGGVDSSFVASMLPKGQVRRAYTLAFPAEDLARDIIPDETRYARRIAAENGLELVEVPMSFSADQFLDTVRALEEPVGDPAAVSTRALCAAASEKVLLSGMGGDELWGGYPRMRALEMSRRLPLATQPVARFLQRVLPHAGPLGRVARNFAKLSTGAGLAWGDRHVRYLSYVSPEERRALLVDCPADAPHARLAALRPDAAGDEYDASLRFDLEQFLPCHNLHYTDKASMWESKEVRVPLLGNRMLEVAARFPSAQKREKAPLKAAARGVVADEILDRRKAGFGAPVQGWLAGPLRPLVDEYLSETSVRRRGWFQPEGVQRLIRDEREGRTHRYLLIYELLVLETWARTFLDA
jgi:asparagine synthase (glutamine-hydrolysing)